MVAAKAIKQYHLYVMKEDQNIIGSIKSFLEAQQDAGIEWLNIPKSCLGPSILQGIRASIHNCCRCKLSSARANIVFGDGDPHAKLMFIGEAPGIEEDKSGLPFVGKAGALLTKIIQAIDLTRDRVYISSIVKCHPPGNRTPEADEIASCKPFMIQQIQAIHPAIICTLGAVATHSILQTEKPITRLRGRFYEFQGIKVMPTFHPAYLLRNPQDKRLVWEDMQKIQALYRESGLYDL